MSTPFTLGINYWPRSKAMYWWSNFDAGEVREDFALLQDLGMSVARIFLLWDDWQKTPNSVSSECMRALEQVCDAAAAHRLTLDVTFFTGHMSGPNWSPAWLLDPTTRPPAPGKHVSGGREVDQWYRNFFTDADALAAQRLLLQTVVSTFHQHAGIGMWNLGNEPDLYAVAPDRATGKAWVQEMTSLIKAIDLVHPVTCGLHIESLRTQKALRVDDTFGITDVAVMHAYPMYMSWVENPLDAWFVPYTCALTTALCGKPTLAEEFGGCTAAPGEDSQTWAWMSYGDPRTQFMASEEAFADYIAEVLPNLQRAGATGAMLWCFADYAPELWEKPPLLQSKHERFFGLVRPNGSLKPHAQVIKAFAATQPQVQTPARPFDIGITPDEFYRDPAGWLQKLYPKFKTWVKS
jgi:endo-1,4-beta-mannosidase